MTKKSNSIAFYALILLLLGLVALSAMEFWRRDAAALFWITCGYFSYEMGVSLLLVSAAARGLRQRWRLPAAPAPAGPIPALTVLIAAHNERLCILDTLESVFAQEGVGDLRVIVASDGSTDGMQRLIAERYGAADPRLRVLDLPKVGKGAVLNAALAEAQTPVVATLDADTRLAPGALAALAGLFRAPEMVSAGGFIYVRNARGGPWIVRYQYWEYLKNFIWRIGLAHMGVCLQVSGAFGAFRAAALRELGGFSENSLVEDYEIIYRLHERFRRAGWGYRVAVAPDAVAYTDSPDDVPSFIHQRTRWFTGFLQTLWEYRRMVFDPRMGAVGLFMLPMKCVDAVLPLWGSISLAILLGAALCGHAEWRLASFSLFGLKLTTDLLLSALMLRWHRRLSGGREKARGLLPLTLAWHIATEGLVFNWFRQIAVLNAYVWFTRRVRRWRQPRWENTDLETQGAA